MQSTSAKGSRKPRTGFTKIDNAFIDNPNLTAAEKLVAIKLQSHAYGTKTWANPSQLELSGQLRLDRKTVKAALESLSAFGIVRPHGEGHQGKQETYTVNLDAAANLGNPHISREESAPMSLGESAPINKSKTKQTKNKKPIPSAPTAIRGDTLADDSAENGTCSAYEGLGESAPMFTKAQINALKLTPNGKKPEPYFGADELLPDLDTQLCLVGGKVFNGAALRTLVADFGIDLCAFWCAWLPRKIASERSAGRAVSSPAGLYTKAVREAWEVDPNWPEYEAYSERNPIPF
jgi:hypothetical protein